VDIYRIDVATGNEKPVVSQPGRDGDPSWSPDGRWIAFHSQAGSRNYFEARHVAVVPITGGAIRYISEGRTYDVFRNGNAFGWPGGSSALRFTAGKGVHDLLVEEDLAVRRMSILAQNVSGAASFTPDGRLGIYVKVSPERPPELYLRDNRGERQTTHLHDSDGPNVPMRSEVVRWKSSDGLEIEGVLWFPANSRPGKRIPILTELHGGPTGVSLHAYPMPRVYPIQLFIQNGFGVFSPNFRGSANYGAEFRLKNAQSQGIGDYQDVMTGIDHLVAAGIADADKLGVMGWSYGGYLTASVISQTNRFRAASVGAPATDWVTYYGQSDASPDILATYFGGSPWEVPENYARHSPRSCLKNVRTPALLQVGALDINHNAEIYRALTDHHVPVEYVVYPREGHGITEPAHVRDLLQRNSRWFLRWLGPKGVNESARQ
jgi:dipeptidyl aminopeptidase/acylaminoacyl peptidase